MGTKMGTSDGSSTSIDDLSSSEISLPLSISHGEEEEDEEEKRRRSMQGGGGNQLVVDDDDEDDEDVDDFQGEGCKGY